MKVSFLFISLTLSTLGFSKTYAIKVTKSGFEPSTVKVQKGEDVTLNVTRVSESTCAIQIQIPSLKIKRDLPLNKPVTIKLGKVSEEKIKFGCGMGMMAGGVIT